MDLELAAQTKAGGIKQKTMPLKTTANHQNFMKHLQRNSTEKSHTLQSNTQTLITKRDEGFKIIDGTMESTLLLHIND